MQLLEILLRSSLLYQLKNVFILWEYGRGSKRKQKGDIFLIGRKLFLYIFIEMSAEEAETPAPVVEEVNPGENVDQGAAENLRDVSSFNLSRQ